MRHLSVPISDCEFINIERINPLISKCQIKVCYVGDQPNRNRSIITKEVAAELAQSLPGSPIVGSFNKKEKDFEEHNRIIEQNEDGEYVFVDDTQPYGFVDINAKVWFQKFLDDNEFEREYLVTEGYVWTGQFPESQRIVSEGNNQSMELDDKTIKAQWTKGTNGNGRFFIINEAIISKLCILGEDYEPCFEGATITGLQFSLGNDFNTKFAEMVQEFKHLIDEGGEKTMNENQIVTEEQENTSVESTSEDTEFKKKPDDEEDKKDKATEDSSEDKDNSDESKDSNSDNSTEDDSSKKDDSEDEDEDEEDKKKKKSFSLEDIPEYVELENKYAQLVNDYALLENKNRELNDQLAPLISFRNQIEKKQKEDMINSFYMLNDEDKKDVVENIDKYSLDDIEAKLSVICVRNKLNLSDVEEEANENPTSYNLGGNLFNDDESIPAWVKAALDTEKKLNN